MYRETYRSFIFAFDIIFGLVSNLQYFGIFVYIFYQIIRDELVSCFVGQMHIIEFDLWNSNWSFIMSDAAYNIHVLT